MTHSLPPIERLKAVMARLRDKDRGCPWDVEQDFASIAPYTIEEAYEVADAIERDDMSGLREELGDLLFQVVFHARMAEEQNLFDFNDVADDLASKMIRRHPHVFASADIKDSAQQTEAWEAHKARERNEKSGDASALANVPVGLPAATRAQKIQKRASRVGFDWGSALPALDKVAEEVAELRAELEQSEEKSPGPVTEGAGSARTEEEIGDLLFAVVNVARLAGVDGETALRRATQKFERRFRHVEDMLASRGRKPEQSTLQEMDALWDEAKKAERAAAGG